MKKPEYLSNEWFEAQRRSRNRINNIMIAGSISIIVTALFIEWWVK